MPKTHLTTVIRIAALQNQVASQLQCMGYEVKKTTADNGHIQVVHKDHFLVNYYPSTGTFTSPAHKNPTHKKVKGVGLANLIAWLKSLETDK